MTKILPSASVHVQYELRNLFGSYQKLKRLKRFDRRKLEHIAYLSLFASSCRALIEYFDIKTKSKKSKVIHSDQTYPYSISVPECMRSQAFCIWDQVSKGSAHISDRRDHLPGVEPTRWMNVLRPALEDAFKRDTRLRRKFGLHWEKALRRMTMQNKRD